MVFNTQVRIPEFYIELYKWENMEEGSATQTVRNNWLWLFGSFGKMHGVYFPCRVVKWNIQMEPVVVTPLLNQGSTAYDLMVRQILPQFIMVEKLDRFYYALPVGQDIRHYAMGFGDPKLQRYNTVQRMVRTKASIDQAINRSLDTGVVKAPRRFGKAIKRALDTLRRGEYYVLEGSNLELNDISIVDMPDTTDKLSRLWETYDWSEQEYLIRLGFAFNPEKRERMIVSEMQAHSQVISANRELLTETLRPIAEKYGEKVMHMGSYVEEEFRDMNAITPNGNRDTVNQQTYEY